MKMACGMKEGKKCHRCLENRGAASTEAQTLPHEYNNLWENTWRIDPDIVHNFSIFYVEGELYTPALCCCQNTLDSQCCISFMCRAKWLRLMYVYVRDFSIVGYYKILSIVPCAISRSLLVTYFLYSSIYFNPKLLIYPCPLFPLITMFVFYICKSICSVNKFICIIFLDSIYKPYRMIFVPLCLAYFTYFDNL